jgi:hypothetical protein
MGLQSADSYLGIVVEFRVTALVTLGLEVLQQRRLLATT